MDEERGMTTKSNSFALQILPLKRRVLTLPALPIGDKHNSPGYDSTVERVSRTSRKVLMWGV